MLGHGGITAIVIAEGIIQLGDSVQALLNPEDSPSDS